LLLLLDDDDPIDWSTVSYVINFKPRCQLKPWERELELVNRRRQYGCMYGISYEGYEQSRRAQLEKLPDDASRWARLQEWKQADMNLMDTDARRVALRDRSVIAVMEHYRREYGVGPEVTLNSIIRKTRTWLGHHVDADGRVLLTCGAAAKTVMLSTLRKDGFYLKEMQKLFDIDEHDHADGKFFGEPRDGDYVFVTSGHVSIPVEKIALEEDATLHYRAQKRASELAKQTGPGRLRRSDPGTRFPDALESQRGRRAVAGQAGFDLASGSGKAV